MINNELQSKITADAAIINDLKSSNKELKDTINELNSSVNGHINEVNYLKNNNNLFILEADKMRKELRNCEERRDELLRELQSLKETNSTTPTSVKKVVLTPTASDAPTGDVLKVFMDNQLDLTKNEFTYYEEVINNLASQLEEITENNNQNMLRIEALDQQLIDQKRISSETIADLEQKINAYETLVQSKDDEVTLAEQALKEIQVQFEHAKNIMNEKINNLANSKNMQTSPLPTASITTSPGGDGVDLPSKLSYQQVNELQAALEAKDNEIKTLMIQLQSLQDSVTELQQSNATLKQQKKGLKDYVEGLKSELNGKSVELDSATVAHQQLVASLTAENANNKTMITKLQSDLQMILSSNSTNEAEFDRIFNELNASTNQNAKYVEQIAALQAELTTAYAASNELDISKNQSEQYVEEIATLQAELTTAHAASTSYTSQIAALQAELTAAHAASTRYTSQIAALQAELTTAHAASTKYIEQIAELQDELSVEKGMVQNLHEILNSSTSKDEEKDVTIRTLHDNIRNLNDKLASTQSVLSATSNSLVDHQEKIFQLQSELSNVTTATNNSMGQKITELEAQVASLNGIIASNASNLEQNNREYNILLNTKNNLEEELEDVRMNHVQLQSEHQALVQAHDNSMKELQVAVSLLGKVDASDAVVADNKDYTKLTKSQEAILGSVAIFNNSTISKTIESNFIQSNHTIYSAEVEKSRLTNFLQQKTDLYEKLMTNESLMTNELNGTKLALTKVQLEYNDILGNLRVKEEELRAKSDESRDKESQLSSMIKDNNAVTQQLHHAQSEYTTLHGKYTGLCQEHASMQSLLSTLRDEIVVLKSQVSTDDSTVEELKQKINQLRSDRDQIVQERCNDQVLFNELRSTNENLGIEKMNITSKLANMTVAYESLDKDLASSKTTIDSLNKQIIELKQSIQEINTTMLSKEDVIINDKLVVTEQREEIRQLKCNVDTLTLELTGYRDTSNYQNTKISQLIQELNDIKSEYYSFKSTDYKELLLKSTSNEQSLQDKITALTKVIASHEDTIDRKTKEIEAMRSKIDIYGQDNCYLHSELDHIVSNHNNNVHVITELKQQLDVYKGHIMRVYENMLNVTKNIVVPNQQHYNANDLLASPPPSTFARDSMKVMVGTPGSDQNMSETMNKVIELLTVYRVKMDGVDREISKLEDDNSALKKEINTMSKKHLLDEEQNILVKTERDQLRSTVLKYKLERENQVSSVSNQLIALVSNKNHSLDTNIADAMHKISNLFNNSLKQSQVSAKAMMHVKEWIRNPTHGIHDIRSSSNGDADNNNIVDDLLTYSYTEANRTIVALTNVVESLVASAPSTPTETENVQELITKNQLLSEQLSYSTSNNKDILVALQESEAIISDLNAKNKQLVEEAKHHRHHAAASSSGYNSLEMIKLNEQLAMMKERLATVESAGANSNVHVMQGHIKHLMLEKEHMMDEINSLRYHNNQMKHLLNNAGQQQVHVEYEARQDKLEKEISQLRHQIATSNRSKSTDSANMVNVARLRDVMSQIRELINVVRMEAQIEQVQLVTPQKEKIVYANDSIVDDFSVSLDALREAVLWLRNSQRKSHMPVTKMSSNRDELVRELEHKLAAVTSSRNNFVQLTEKLEQQLSNKAANTTVSSHVFPEVYDLELSRYKNKVNLLTNVLACYRDSFMHGTTSSLHTQELVQLRNAYDTEVNTLESELQILQSQLDVKDKHIHELRVRFEDAYKHSNKSFGSNKESLLVRQLEDTRRLLEVKEQEVSHLSSKLYSERRKQSHSIENKENSGINSASTHMKSKHVNSEAVSTTYHVGNGFLRVKK